MEFDFGSYHRDFEPESWEFYLDAVASVLVQRLTENENVKTKSMTRRKLNMDSLYRKYYEPIMQESALWTKGAK